MPSTSTRPTKASLLRQSKIRLSLHSAPFAYQKSLKQITNMYSHKQEQLNISECTLNVKQQQQKKAGSGVMKNAVFKHRSVQKLAVIMSESSRENSTKESEMLKQVIVSSLTETVKNLEIAVDNQENKPPEQRRALKQRVIPSSKLKAMIMEEEASTASIIIIKQLKIVIIEPPSTSDNDFNDELDEDEYRINGEIYVMNYIRDIMNLLYALESHYQIDNSYLQVTSTRTTIPSKTWKMTLKHRTILVEWLIQLFYCRFHLSQDSLHVCMQLLDRYLQYCSSPSVAAQTTNVLKQKNLQLIGVATLLLATKVEETHHPSVDDLIFLTDNAYTGDQLKAMERKILQDLSFELNRPTSLQFLRRYSFVSSASDEQHSIGKYLIDLALLDYHCMNYKPSLIAASATYIARYLLTYKANESFDYYCPEELRTMTPYKTYEHLTCGIRTLSTLLLKASSKTNIGEYSLLFKKYEHENLSNASAFCVKQQNLIQKLVNDCQ